MRINLQVSLIALLFTMASLSQPSWSMEDDDSKKSERKRKRENGEELEKSKGEDVPKRRMRKFNRKRQTPPTGFNDLPTEIQAEVLAHALAQGGRKAYLNLSLVSKFSRDCTQGPAVLRQALSLADPRVAWDPVEEGQDQNNIKPLLWKLFVIEKALYPEPCDDPVQVIPFLTALKQNPTSHILVTCLATYVHNQRFSSCFALDGMVPREDLEATINKLKKTKDFLVSGLLENRKIRNLFDSLKYESLKYEAFLIIHYVLSEGYSSNASSTVESMEKEFSLEGELKEIEETIRKIFIKKTFLKSPNLVFELRDYNPIQLRLITLIYPFKKTKRKVPVLKWLAAQGDLESLRRITSYYRTGLESYLEYAREPYDNQHSNSFWDEENSYFWYSQIKTDKNHPLYTEALYQLGMLYLNPYKKFILRDDEKGIKFLEEAAKAGEPRACLEIGKRYISGSLVEQDIDEGTKWLEKAARLGEPGGLYYLYEAYSEGEVVSQDKEKAEEYLEKAVAKKVELALSKKHPYHRPAQSESKTHSPDYPFIDSQASPSGPLEDLQTEVTLGHYAIPPLPITIAQPFGSTIWRYDPQAVTNNSDVREEEDSSIPSYPQTDANNSDIPAQENFFMPPYPQDNADNSEGPRGEDSSMLYELFGDIDLTEEAIERLLLTQENPDEDLGS